MENIQYEHYLPVVLAALTVLILGMWNPKSLQAKSDESVRYANQGGAPSYKWLALLALLVGMICVYSYNVKPHHHY